MKTTTIRMLSALSFLALAACAAPAEEDDLGAAKAPLLAAKRPGTPDDLAPGVGASACKSDTCVAGPSNDCSDFDDACKAEAGCGVTTGGNPIAQVHTCVTIPEPPPASVGGGSAPADLAPGVGASACKSDTCVAGPSNDCSDFDDECKAEAGCGVTTGGNPIAQVHTCVTIPKPPPASVGGGSRPTKLVPKTPTLEEECHFADSCDDLIAACIGGDHIWVCHTYGELGRCVDGECVGAP